MLTDRIGERPVLAGGLFATSLAIFVMAFTEGFPALLVGLFVTGAFGASATGASGRAVMGWFTRHERGYALGIRQMALPVGGSRRLDRAAAARGRGGSEGGVPGVRRTRPDRRDRRGAAHARRASAPPGAT